MPLSNELPNEWRTMQESEWTDWKWQMRNCVRDVKQLNSILESFTEMRVRESSFTDHVTKELFAFKVTPFMVAALKHSLDSHIKGAWTAFSASFTPKDFESARESTTSTARIDTIGEDLQQSNPVPSITRFYRNRVLLRMTHMCPAYCRYCFRRRLVGDALGAWNQTEIDSALSYIRADRSIEEVILSGGDPLVLGDDRLEYVLSRLREVDHIRRIRIDTKALTMLPQRFTADLVSILRRFRLTALVGHFSHVYELTPEVEAACSRLADSGVPVYAHIPLLRDISDDEIALTELVEALIDFRVRPYYLIQFIGTSWTEHFRVSINRGLQLIDYLHKHCTGLAVPTFVVYLPSGHGKVPILPSYLIKRSDDGYVFRAHDGVEVVYREPLINGDRPEFLAPPRDHNG